MTTRVVILAAGQGKRMGLPEFPKVLTPLRGRPLVHYVYDAVVASGVDPEPVVVVGVKAEMVEESLGAGPIYVDQAEQRGTGDAVRAAEPILKSKTDAVIVLYGDQPFIEPETIRRLRDAHAGSDAAITMLTVQVPEENEWRKFFNDFGRVMRDAAGSVTKIVEMKDASPEKKAISEFNCAFFCFNAPWLWDHLGALQTTNVQGEYYLTDLIHIAIGEGRNVQAITIDPREAFGVNTPEQLALAEELITKNKERRRKP